LYFIFHLEKNCNHLAGLRKKCGSIKGIFGLAKWLNWWNLVSVEAEFKPQYHHHQKKGIFMGRLSDKSICPACTRPWVLFLI
jgi:hypothetical protein